MLGRIWYQGGVAKGFFSEFDAFTMWTAITECNPSFSPSSRSKCVEGDYTNQFILLGFPRVNEPPEPTDTSKVHPSLARPSTTTRVVQSGHD